MIELMVVVAIVAILALVALPSYADYVRGGRFVEATGQLAHGKTYLEQVFQDTMAYANATGTKGCAAGDSGVTFTGSYFQYSCALKAGTSGFTLTATGLNGGVVSGYVFSIDEQGNKTSTGPGIAGILNCWIRRPGTTC